MIAAGMAVLEVQSDWYRSAFTPEMADMAWAQNTDREVDRALTMLRPSGTERILDLACGNGRHALELTRRGFSVVGVDISEPLIEVAKADADSQGLDATFIQADLRELDFEEEFDIVLNLNDGAIGYLETDEENQRTFETVARALRPGGRQLMQLPNVLHAQKHLPQKSWIESSDAIELVEHQWNKKERCLYGSMRVVRFGEPFEPDDAIVFRQRLYGIEELDSLLQPLGMRVTNAFRGNGKPRNPDDSQYEVFVEAQKA